MTLDDMRAVLERDGFQIAPNALVGRDNDATWYAYRRARPESVICECNEKPAQIVAYPHQFKVRETTHTGIEMEVCGQRDGTWWKLRAYAITPSELEERLPAIEAGLVRAWNAIKP